MTVCEPKSGGRILCIRLSGLGDVVHALNALGLLRRHRPEAHLAWAVEDRFADLLRRHPHVDELITVPREAWGSMAKDPFRWPRLGREVRALLARLRAEHYDATVDFQSSLKSAWMVAAAGAEQRIGFGPPVNRELNRVVQTELVRCHGRRVHRIERDLALLGPLGIPTRYAAPALPPAETDAADRVLEGRSPEGPVVVIHPGTSEFAAFKRWMPFRYARVADELVRRRGALVVVTWGPADRHLAEEVVDSMQEDGLLAPPTEGLRALLGLLSRADLFLGSDTGPMHLASAAGTPVVALFGPKDQAQTGPYCSRSLVVSGRAECRPCERRRCPHPRCMTSIRAEQVIGAALALLGGAGRCRARQGPVREAVTRRFQLGRWRGEIATAYSSPAFYRRLCSPRELAAGGEELTGVRRSVTAPGSGGLAVPRLEAELDFGWHGPGRGRRREAHARWRGALRLAGAGVPVAFPVCWMRKGAGVEELLLTEHLEGATPLANWLEETHDGWEGMKVPLRETLTESVAGLVRRLHRAGFCHGRLTADNLLVQPEDSDGRLPCYLTDPANVRRVAWLPPLARDLLWARELKKLLRSLPGAVPAADAVGLLGAYCRGFIDAPHRRRTFELVLGRALRASPRGTAREHPRG